MGDPAAGEGTHGGLRWWVDTKRCHAFRSSNGRIQDDGTTLFHQRQRFLHREQKTLHIDVKMQVKVFFGDLADGCQIAEARIGEQNIDMAVFFFYGCIKTVKVFHISDITLNTDSLVAADFLERYVDLILAATSDDDIRSFSNKTLVRREPHTPIASGSH